MRKRLVSILSTSLIAGSLISGTSVFADSNDGTKTQDEQHFISDQGSKSEGVVVSDFYAPQELTDADLEKLDHAIEAVPQPAENQNQKSSLGLFFDPVVIAPTALMAYNFYDLAPGHRIPSKNSFTTSSKGSVSLTLVQYLYPAPPSGMDPDNIDVYYYIENSSWTSDPLKVHGTWRDKNTTITFQNIPAGTWQVVIVAASTNKTTIQGNGYIN